MRALLALVPPLFLAACFGNETTDFPPGFEPLEEINRAALPAAEGEETFPQRLEVASGNRDSYDWAHARGYVHAPLSRVYEALRVDGVVADRRNVAEYSSEATTSEGADSAMIIHNTVEDVLTVRFDITYRYKQIAEDTVAVRFQKTYGTELIGLIEGSIILTEVDDDRTQVDFIEHIRAALSGEERIRQSLLDVHESAIAWLAGQPLPAY